MFTYLALLFLLGTISAQESGDGFLEDNIEEHIEAPVLSKDESEQCQNITEWSDKEKCTRLHPEDARYYFVIFKQRRSFYRAQRRCKCRGGNLSSIHNANSNAYIARLARCANTGAKLVWIGLRKYGKRKPFQNVDGSRLNYSNWGYGQPKKQCRRRCAALNMYNGRWRTVKCWKRLPFVCTI